MRKLPLFFLLLMPSMAWACEMWDDTTSPEANWVIGEVTINNQDVFDSSQQNENQFIHQLTNRLHIETQRKVIAAQLLFKSGDPFDAELLSETARNLRTNTYLRSASVTPIKICDSRVDVDVTTGDNWSLIPGFNFSRAGGENEYSFRLAELNLLGLGKRLEIEFDFTTDRDQRILQYFDPMLFSTKTQFTAQLQNNSDGEVQLVKFEQPFLSLDSRRSWRISASNSEYLQKLYKDGRVVDQLAVDRELLRLEYGISKGKQGNQVTRLAFGLQFDSRKLAPTAAFPESSPVAERVYSYPYLQTTWLKPKYLEQRNLQLMESVEDIAIGHELRARLGVASEAFGSSSDALVLETEYGKGWFFDNKVLTLFNASANGYINDDGVENGIAKGSLQGFYFFSRRSRSYASLNLVSTSNLFENNQLVLGGATGLRGYPLKFQTGATSARLSLEQRYFFDWYPLRLVRIGAAAFADIGSAWDAGEDPEWLRDAGLGLRIVGTRQADARVMHIDLAMPFDGTDAIDQFQLVVTAKSQF